MKKLGLGILGLLFLASLGVAIALTYICVLIWDAANYLFGKEVDHVFSVINKDISESRKGQTGGSKLPDDTEELHRFSYRSGFQSINRRL